VMTVLGIQELAVIRLGAENEDTQDLTLRLSAPLGAVRSACGTGCIVI
jgi:hypothetical protein